MSPSRTIAMCLVAGALPASGAVAQSVRRRGPTGHRAGCRAPRCRCRCRCRPRRPRQACRLRPWRRTCALRPSWCLRPRHRRIAPVTRVDRRNATATGWSMGGASSPARTSRAAPSDAQPRGAARDRAPSQGKVGARAVSWHPAALCLASLLGIVGLFFVPAVAPTLLKLEHWTADWRTALLSDRQATTHPGLAIVAITSETLEPYPFMLPIDRGLQAKIVAAVVGAGARAVALDFYFTKGTIKDTDDGVPSRPDIAAGQAHPRGVRESR